MDPLGFYPIADALAVKLVPGVRERHNHPRFLTAIAVSTTVTAGFDDDALAKDGVSPPWQVFEWHLVEGLVRTLRTAGELTGLPGQDKAAAAITSGLPLSARTYLKTPRTFGFHGVYRTLADELQIQSHGRLDEAGWELLKTWTREQGLEGFSGSSNGFGSRWSSKLISAVQEGLQEGAARRSTTWSGWDFFRNHLSPNRIGSREAQCITRLLKQDSKGFWGEILGFIQSNTGSNLAEQVLNKEADERDFHDLLLTTIDSKLEELILAILSYEKFSRYLMNAFEDCLFEMSRNGSKTSLLTLARSDWVRDAAGAVPDLFSEVSDRLVPFGQSGRFEESFTDLSEPASVSDWVSALLEHHYKHQRRKPPNGKNPWFEKFDDGSVIVRPGYRRNERSSVTTGYVDAYRTRPLWSFARDLGLVNTHAQEI